MFNFLSSKPSKKAHVETAREKLINELRSTFPSIRRPNNDDNCFELKLLVDQQYSALCIFIPSDFPSTRPVLQVKGPLQHPWLDQFKQVNCDKLLYWSKTSTLVAVVEECMHALQCGTSSQPGSANSSSRSNTSTGNAGFTNSSNAPAPLAPQAGINYDGPLSNNAPTYLSGAAHLTPPPAPPLDRHMMMAQSPPIAQSSSYSSSNSWDSNGTSNRNLGITNPNIVASAQNMYNDELVRTPEVEYSFIGELENLTELQLQRLLDDDVARAAHVNALPEVKSFRSTRDHEVESATNFTRRNLQKAEELSKIENELAGLQQQLREKYGAHSKQMQSFHQEFGGDKKVMLEELKNKHYEIDDKSEEVGQKFVDGQVELGRFMEEYKKERVEYHIIRAKIQVGERDFEQFDL